MGDDLRTNSRSRSIESASVPCNEGQHKFTTELARTVGAIGIEDLHILGMMAYRKLARAVADAAMWQLLTFLNNKVASARGQIVLGSRWFPSTKSCSGRAHIKKRMPPQH